MTAWPPVTDSAHLAPAGRLRTADSHVWRQPCAEDGSGFAPLTYALYQSATATENLPAVLAARSAVLMVSTPLGTALGGPIVGALGATVTLVSSGVATVLLAAAGAVAWRDVTYVAETIEQI